MALSFTDVLGERRLDPRIAGYLPRPRHLRQSLQLDRMDVGQVDAQLLLEVVRHGLALPESLCA